MPISNEELIPTPPSQTSGSPPAATRLWEPERLSPDPRARAWLRCYRAPTGRPARATVKGGPKVAHRGGAKGDHLETIGNRVFHGFGGGWSGALRGRRPSAEGIAVQALLIAAGESEGDDVRVSPRLPSISERVVRCYCFQVSPYTYSNQDRLLDDFQIATRTP